MNNLLLSFCRSVVVGPKKAGGLPPQGPAASVQTSSAASVSAGSTADSVAVVSSDDASQAASVDSAACKCTNTHTHTLH